MSENEPTRQQERFDRVMGTLVGLPGVRTTRPSTVMQTVPIVNVTTTAVVQTMKTEDDGFLIFLQVVRGEDTVRIVLPNKVAEAIYRQRSSLTDRSTPESRARRKAARDRARAREEKALRSAEWRRKNPGRKVGG